MKIADLIIRCPPMAVRNTGWLPGSDRITDNLPCRGEMTTDFGLVLRFGFTFPPCLVTRIKPGRWEVEDFVGTGTLDEGGGMVVAIPAEPVIRQGSYMMAQPVTSTEGYLQWRGKRYKVELRLPLARGVPQGLFGYWSYLVDAVDVHGTVFD